MSNAPFLSAATTELQQSNNTYTNSRYAPIGNQKVGKPFPLYKQPGGYFTDYRSSGLTDSSWKLQYNLPTNTNFYRTSVIADGVNLANNQNDAWVGKSQTIGIITDTMGCNSTADCGAFKGTTCNVQYQNWPDAYGNQPGGFCSYTVYPELQTSDGTPSGVDGGGMYNRKLANEGGIGRACTNDNDCGDGYSCNNNYDLQGSNLQQTGYCAKQYTCPDGTTHFLGTPWNSGIPKPPPNSQNNGGAGYDSQEQCWSNASAQQNCIKASNGNWYAVYPGYCPVPVTLRQDQKPYGNVRTSSPQVIASGITIPSWATNQESTTGSKVQAFSASWANPSSIHDGSSEAFKYSMNINPMPKNLY